MQNTLHQALFVCTFEVLYVGASIARPQILLRKIYRRKAKSVHYPILNPKFFEFRRTSNARPYRCYESALCDTNFAQKSRCSFLHRLKFYGITCPGRS